MVLTMQEVIPIGLCVATQDLIDAKRFKQNFCDTLILRGRERALSEKLAPFKQELNSKMYESRYLGGHKAVIISNIDKIIAVTTSRYTQIDPNAVSSIVEHGKMLILNVMKATSFDDIAQLEPTFRSRITLPVYDLFMKNLKRSNISMI
ncbi:MAG: hypothetical protein HYW22_01630 [Candidatus Aenigmarchaeota archaeon]|nr:hypothetical protein [Candidatus Aenigmarchaeota archaeon]